MNTVSNLQLLLSLSLSSYDVGRQIGEEASKAQLERAVPPPAISERRVARAKRPVAPCLERVLARPVPVRRDRRAAPRSARELVPGEEERGLHSLEGVEAAEELVGAQLATARGTLRVVVADHQHARDPRRDRTAQRGYLRE